MGVSLPVMGVPGVLGGARGLTLETYLATLGPWLLDYRFNETGGNLINFGTETGADGTVTGCLQGQVGQAANAEAYSFDGADDNIAVANATLPTVKAVTTHRWLFLYNATGLGESNLGSFFNWGVINTGNNRLRFNTTNRLDVALYSSGNAALAVTDNNQATIGAWCLLFMDFDNVTTRKIRLFSAITATVNQLTLATDQAMTGTKSTMTDALYIGNEQGTGRSYAGLMDRILCGTGLWTAPEMAQIASLVF